MHSMLLQVCVVIDHREHQNVVKTSVTHLPAARVPLPFYHNHFDVICDLLLNRSRATLVHVGRVTSFPSSLSYPSRDPGCVPHDLGKGQIHVKCEILMSVCIAQTGQWKVQSVYSGPLKMIYVLNVQCFQSNLCKYRSASRTAFS